MEVDREATFDHIEEVRLWMGVQMWTFCMSL